MGGRVLVVEDDDDLREDLAFLLQHRGCAVDVAANGKQALEKMAGGDKPALILLDLRMPVMDGWTLRRELLDDPQLCDIPVVLLSGMGDNGNETSALHAVARLRKPIDLDELYAVVDEHC